MLDQIGSLSTKKTTLWAVGRAVAQHQRSLSVLVGHTDVVTLAAINPYLRRYLWFTQPSILPPAAYLEQSFTSITFRSRDVYGTTALFPTG